MLHPHGQVPEQIPNHDTCAMPARQFLSRGRGQLPIYDFGVVEGDGVVRAVLVVARGDDEERHSRERGEEEAVAA